MTWHPNEKTTKNWNLAKLWVGPGGKPSLYPLGKENEDIFKAKSGDM